MRSARGLWDCRGALRDCGTGGLVESTGVLWDWWEHRGTVELVGSTERAGNWGTVGSV